MATAERSRAIRSLIGLAGGIAAAVAVAGLLVFVVAATWPIHVTHTVEVAQLQVTGTFDKTLVPTGGSEPLAKTETCIPLRQIVRTGGNHEPAVCHRRDEARLATARGGLFVAAAGAVLMVLVMVAAAVGDRVTRRGPRPRSTPAPR